MVPEWTRPIFALTLVLLCPPSVCLLIKCILHQDGNVKTLGESLLADPLQVVRLWAMLLEGVVRMWFAIGLYVATVLAALFFLQAGAPSFNSEIKPDQLVAAAVVGAIGFVSTVPVAQIMDFELPGAGTTGEAVAILAAFSALQLFFLKVLPGDRFEGPITEHGNVPVYYTNGFKAFTLTVALFFLGSGPLGLFNGGILFDHYEKMIHVMNVFALGFCGVLMVKGMYAPSSTDSGWTGDWATMYYWGAELYPRILGWDVKTFTNCRFGMMLWPVLCLSYASKQYEMGKLSDSMLVSAGVQLVYCAKFFYWESGYWRSTDIHTDRAGF